MSQIHITDGQTDQILDVISAKNILDNKHHKSLKDTLETFDFTTFADKAFSGHLIGQNRVIIPDEDGKHIEFVIHESGKFHGQEGLVCEVYTSASYLMLKKAKVISPNTLNGTAEQHVISAVVGTEWQAGNIEYAGVDEIVLGEYSNPFKHLKRIASTFNLELSFRVEVDGNKVIGRYVDLLERVGQWQGREAEFGKDLIGIRRNEKTDNIVTALVGIGPEREDGTRLEVIVEDGEALARWGRDGQHIIEKYEPESTDQGMTEERLTTLTTTELNKRVNAIVEYETTIADLEHVPGMENKRIRFGDTIKIKDTKFNPALYLEARVHTQDRDIVDQSSKVVELGDYIEYTEDEVRAIWLTLQAEIREKISHYDLVDYTYPKAEIDGKDEGVYQDGTVYSDTVALTAEERAKQHAEEEAKREAEEAEQRAKEYAVAKEAYDDKVAEIMGELADKAGVEYVNGQLILKADSSVVSGLQNEVANKVDAEWVNGQLVSKADANSVYVISEIDNKFDNVVSVTQYETDKNGIITDLQSQESRISQTETDISSKVEQITFNQLADDVGGIGGELSTAKTSIEQNAIAIQSKAEQSSVNTLTGEVSTLESIQIQQANLIDQRVEKTIYDADQDDVINFMNSTNSWRTQTDTAINQRVTTTTYNSGISGLDDKINGIEIGGRNLLKNSAFKETPYRFIRGSVEKTDVDNEIVCVNTTTGNFGYMLEFSEMLEVNREYLLTVYIKSEDVSSFNYISLRRGMDGSNQGSTAANHQHSISNFISDGEYYIYEVVLSTSSEDCNGIMIGTNNGTEFFSKFPKLEKGNKATDWTPAPEDVDARITTAFTAIDQNAQQITLKASQTDLDSESLRIDDAFSELNIQAGRIDLKAESSTVEGLETRVDSAEIDINGLESEIDLRVEKDGVIGSINLTSESATIDVEKLAITGDVEIVNGELKVTHLSAATGTFSGTVETARLVINNPDIEQEGGVGLQLQTAQWQSNASQPYVETGHIEFNTLNDALEIYKINLSGSEVPLDGFRVNATTMDFLGDIYAHGYMYTNAIDHFGAGFNMYIRPGASGEVRVTETGTTSTYLDLRADNLHSQTHVYSAFNFYGGNNSVFRSDSGYAVLRAGGGVVYLQTDNEARVTAVGGASTYRPIRASSFPTGTSLRENKTDIEVFEDDALSVIKNSNAYLYLVKGDNEMKQKQLGLMVDETPRVLHGEYGDSMEMYALNTYVWRGVQQLIEMSDNHEDELNYLKLENQYLNARINEMEALIS